MSPRFLLAAVSSALFATGCNNSGDSMDFERMVNQAHYTPYQAAPFFEDGRAMRTPPEGVVPVERLLGAPQVLTGRETDGRFVEKIPISTSRPMIESGRARFEVHCAPCHGILGDGASVVGQKMDLRAPPSLASAPVAVYPAGRIYAAIAEGYGLMPSYGRALSVPERWAVVAYARALALRAGGMPLQALPEPIRQRALEELK